VKDLTLPSGVTLDEAIARKGLLAKLDHSFKEAEQSPLLESMDEFYQKAYDLIASPAARKAFDIGSESDQTPGRLWAHRRRAGLSPGAAPD